MIHAVTMYAATCDNCGEDWESEFPRYAVMNDKQALYNCMDDWHITDDDSMLCYCPDCHFFDDKDVLHIRTERKVN